MVKAPPDHTPMAVDSQDSSSFESMMPITSPNQLPIHSMRKKIIQTVFTNDCCIFLGETGCGKTTQIPRFLYEAREKKFKSVLNKKPHRNKNLICCTQPRRVAAISVAERVASEVNQKCGQLVGYSVRFDEAVTRQTKIKYMTDGMLLREALLDPNLRQYSIIILDEAHERTLHTDLLFGIVKQALEYRKKSKKNPLHILVMSATMNVDLFSNYFNQAPVLYLQGRQYPIDVFHVQESQTDYIHASLITLFQIHRSKPLNEGILIFLTGQDEIDSTCKTIKHIVASGTESLEPILVLPLYANMTTMKQMLVFKQTPMNIRKVIVSTNIGETSITIPGIRHVIDCGCVKIKTFNPQTGLELLQVQKISQAQAWQRTGRAGRECPGACYRMYTEDEYEKLAPTPIPELLRCNLATAALQILAMGITNISNFDFVSKPDEKSIAAALRELIYLRAVQASNDNTYELTDDGRKMACFPLDPKLSRCLLASSDLGCLEEMLKLVSIMSVDTIFLTSSNINEKMKMQRQKFTMNEGDHLTLLNVYKTFIANKKTKEWCQMNKINRRNLLRACAIRKQLRRICVELQLNIKSCGTKFSSVRQALAHGLFMNVAEYFKENDYRTINDRHIVKIHPSSVLFGAKPSLVVFTELIQTTKRFIRDITVVEPEWLLESNPDYFKTRLSSK
ncbi:unnamed protein product [Rotaria socialis]|uniref:RNA helicase n=1 Tax=Rotaria socialis TaxID=392032 RepID=A0A817WZX0_9BILA|nr:unnamed protein product [Rotaria socialis]CAF4832666.1 unnamed protein product [Rotaria socialis]